MKRVLIVALVVSIICVPALAQKKGEDDFNVLIKRYYAAWNTMNPDNASFLYAQDADLVFFDIAPLKYSGGWQEYRDNFKKNVAPGFSSLTLTCRGADLSVRHVTEDAAMGGHNTIDYALKNDSASPCTLMGYPSFELLDKSGKVRPRGRAINSQQLPGDESKQPPQSVALEPGKEAWFRVYYNSGGAGYVGKPCPVSRKVRITPPGATRRLVLQEQITSCRGVQVSAVRGGLPQ